MTTTEQPIAAEPEVGLPKCYLCGAEVEPGADWPNDDVDYGNGAHAHSGCLADFEDARIRDEPPEA
jgi:hypothetical protein